MKQKNELFILLPQQKPPTSIASLYVTVNFDFIGNIIFVNSVVEVILSNST